VEDGSLGELESVLLDRLRAYVRPHGSLPRGSVVLLGSVSHLTARGLSDYAESFVATAASLKGKLGGGGVEVVPLVPILHHGLTGQHAIRSLLDFDTWLCGSKPQASCCLMATRKFFWDIAMEGEGNGTGERGGEAQVHFLPTDLKNSQKVPFTSEPVDPPLTHSHSSL